MTSTWCQLTGHSHRHMLGEDWLCQNTRTGADRVRLQESSSSPSSSASPSVAAAAAAAAAVWMCLQERVWASFPLTDGLIVSLTVTCVCSWGQLMACVTECPWWTAPLRQSLDFFRLNLAPSTGESDGVLWLKPGKVSIRIMLSLMQPAQLQSSVETCFIVAWVTVSLRDEWTFLFLLANEKGWSDISADNRATTAARIPDEGLRFMPLGRKRALCPPQIYCRASNFSRFTYLKREPGS